MIESDIQRSIVDYLRAVLPQVVIFAVPNSSRRTKGGRATNAVPGLLPGVSDLIMVMPGGRVMFIEVKAIKGRLSPAQEIFRDRLERLGHDVVVVCSIEDTRAELARAQIPTRETT